VCCQSCNLYYYSIQGNLALLKNHL
jgi:hypothetical protein